MLTSKVAKRYAQGLLEFTQETGQTATVFEEMKSVVKIMNESRDLSRFFQTPFIDVKKKSTVADEVFKSFSEASKNLIKLVVKHGRENHLKDVAYEFVNKVEDLNGVQRVSLITASPLAQKTVDDIIKSSGLVHTNAEFVLHTHTKPEILGGYILRVGDQQIDASVKSKLNAVKKDFQLN